MAKRIKPNIFDNIDFRRTRYILISATLIVVALIIYTTSIPIRSVSKYCKVYTAEKIRLSKLPGDTYPSQLFDDYLSDAGEISSSISKLENVAPNDIRPEVKILRSFYERLNSDPSQLLAVSVAAKPVDASVSNWTISNCKQP